ncbi:FMN-binding protein [Demequina gelatinilytica]|uniref:FMN-binding protein n=1 Tax=Demequina gelatinilytica TaxID=1638980 RepID=UPI0007862545|nr:FMN-binding protein [Demequina gelatinilytica]
MKRSSSIIVTGISATLLSVGAVMGSGFLDTGTSTSTAASSGSSTALDVPSGTSAETSTDSSADTSTDTSTDTATSDAGSSGTSGSSGGSGTYDGEAVSSRYGTFQAEITVEDGVITDIAWLQSGESDHHSQAINEYAIPVLEDAILQAQDTNVGYVSGASYTSEAVEEAIDSAMQAAGLA